MITFKAKTESGQIIKSALSPFTFPAGEAHTKREERRELESTEIAVLQFEPDSIHDDLFQLQMWTDYILRESYEKKKRIRTAAVIPYFPGARADRGKPFGLQMYTEFISRLLIDEILIFDPHSPETLNQLREEHQKTKAFYSTMVLGSRHANLFNFKQYAGVIAPDKGAVSRASDIAAVLGIPLFKAEKTRNEETGKLSGFTVEPLPEQGKLLLVDDICDAGGTFLGLAEASGLPKDRLDLYVSHGVFSRDALTELPKKFGKIFTTNSYNPRRDLQSTGLSGPFIRFDVTSDLLTQVGQ
ncbi:phosphoribosyl transferase [Arthrobacter phage Racecar]|nr:phosphoribosyl pyrophosphate transferase [Arthrobacter phage Racecar]QFG12825.1 phosphoribosyl pyrophosphate transferase [Arthrobacter phage Mimi]